MAMNMPTIDENWKVTRGLTTARWSLMEDFDLIKVDEADDKYDRFVTMLQVKYGYTRQRAREEFSRVWAVYELKNRDDP